jgi:hypothetical protein
MVAGRRPLACRLCRLAKPWLVINFRYGCHRLEAHSMSKNTSVPLGNHFSSFVDRQLAQGRYASASAI